MRNIGRQIAAENSQDPEMVAEVICQVLFDQGPARLSAKDRYTAIQGIKGALVAWKNVLMASLGAEAGMYKKQAEDLKRELDEVRMRLAIALKEQ